MREYLPGRGRLAHRMMTQTASIQCSFDFENEDDWRRKFRAAHVLTPLVQAIFCNSPFRDGRPNGFLSYRARVWEQTDPGRCGFLPAAFADEPSMEAYVQYALDVPMMFLVREGRWMAMRGYSFRRFLEKGHQGAFATTEDWGLHLSGIFTQVRLKSYIEVRAHDLVPAPLAMAVPALWKGVLYDRDALEAAVALMDRLTYAQAMSLMAQAARRGLRAEHQGRPLLDRARRLAEIAAEGLRRQRRRRKDGRDESMYLLPLQELLRRGLTPADDLLARFHREWKGNLLLSLE
jgi:glutamate--cysteine ligase